jgi:toxin ParE1/3/4
VKPHRFHRRAEAEYAEAAQYYANINPELGGRFYDEIERLIAEIRAHPQLFRKFAPPARRHFSRVFPHTVIYLDRPDHVWIVGIMHFKRHPASWKERL